MSRSDSAARKTNVHAIAVSDMARRFHSPWTCVAWSIDRDDRVCSVVQRNAIATLVHDECVGGTLQVDDEVACAGQCGGRNVERAVAFRAEVVGEGAAGVPVGVFVPNELRKRRAVPAAESGIKQIGDRSDADRDGNEIHGFSMADEPTPDLQPRATGWRSRERWCGPTTSNAVMRRPLRRGNGLRVWTKSDRERT